MTRSHYRRYNCTQCTDAVLGKMKKKNTQQNTKVFRLYLLKLRYLQLMDAEHDINRTSENK